MAESVSDARDLLRIHLVLGNFGNSEIPASYGQNLRELARTYGKNLHSVTSRDSELTSYEYGAKGNDRPGL